MLGGGAACAAGALSLAMLTLNSTHACRPSFMHWIGLG